MDTSIKTKWYLLQGSVPQGRWLEELEVQLSFKGNQTEKKKGIQKQTKYWHNIILESQKAFAYREYPIYL